MRTIRDELCRLMELNEVEQWVPSHIAFAELQQFGEALVPGLIECLADKDPDVRQLAVALLEESGSKTQIPALIERLSDPVQVVRIAAARSLARFGSHAAAALPLLEPWLQDRHEYVRIVATVTILQIDPHSRRQLMPLVEDALRSDHPMVQFVAGAYLAETRVPGASPRSSAMSDRANETLLKELVTKWWHHLVICDEFNWKAEYAGPNDQLQVIASPIQKEIYGGKNDGMIIWAPYLFNATAFGQEPGVELEIIGCVSTCEECANRPAMGISGTLLGKPFALYLAMEPLPVEKPLEMIDTTKEEDDEWRPEPDVGDEIPF